MHKLSPETRLKTCQDVRFRRVLDEAVVIRQQAAETLVLNDVAAAVLERCDGETSLATIVEQLLGEYAVDAGILSGDVYRFAGELQDAGLVETVDPR